MFDQHRKPPSAAIIAMPPLTMCMGTARSTDHLRCSAAHTIKGIRADLLHEDLLKQLRTCRAAPGTCAGTPHCPGPVSAALHPHASKPKHQILIKAPSTHRHNVRQSCCLTGMRGSNAIPSHKWEQAGCAQARISKLLSSSAQILQNRLHLGPQAAGGGRA